MVAVDPSQVVVRKAEARDIPSIIEIQATSPNAAQWTSEHYLRIQQQGWLFVAETSGQVVAFIAGQSAAGEAELLNMAVASGATRQGIGSALVRALLESSVDAGATRILLEVRASNAAAIALYKKCAFLQDGLRKNYYSDPVEDALLFSLPLHKSS
jgi:ribosomal-protein-alanine N-acetyltransferase